MRHGSWGIGCLLALLLAPGAAAQVGSVRLTDALTRPTYVTAAPGDDDRLFVTERAGKVVIVDPVSGAIQATPFLSVPSQTLPNRDFDTAVLA